MHLLDVAWGAGEPCAMPRPSQHPVRARLGPEYRKLWTATAISTLGDGMYLGALPLLAAQLTRDPLAVSAVTFASWLPWLLVALVSGALVDRWDRRRLLWTVDLGRCARRRGPGGVGEHLAARHGRVPAGGGADPVRQRGPGDHPHTGLPRSGTTGAGQRPPWRGDDRRPAAGPPVGGVVFTVAAWLRFGADAVSFAASAALVASSRGRFAAERPEVGSASSLRAKSPRGCGSCLPAGCCVPWPGWSVHTRCCIWPPSRSWCCSPRRSWGLAASASACCWPPWPWALCPATCWPLRSAGACRPGPC